jgi:hypothetical protein
MKFFILVCLAAVAVAHPISNEKVSAASQHQKQSKSYKS